MLLNEKKAKKDCTKYWGKVNKKIDHNLYQGYVKMKNHLSAKVYLKNFMTFTQQNFYTNRKKYGTKLYTTTFLFIWNQKIFTKSSFKKIVKEL